MTVADITLAVFISATAFVFLACVAQIARAIKDHSGAQPSHLGRAFLASHACAIAYAIENQKDWTMAFHVFWVPSAAARLS